MKTFFAVTAYVIHGKNNTFESAAEFNLCLHNFILSVKRNVLPEVKLKGGYADTKNGIELTRNEILEEIKMIEDCAKERCKNAFNDSVVLSTNESIGKTENHHDMHNLQLIRTMDRF